MNALPVRHTTYLRYEVLRTFRNRRFMLFSLVFPLILFLTVAGSNRHTVLAGIPFPLYYMTGMTSWGTMVAMTSSGARIAAERQVGWTRQLRITPLRTSTYFRVKILGGYLMAALSMLALFVAGSALGVRLSATQWLTMIVLVFVGLIPFAILGILLGHLLVPDSMGPALGGITALFALLGGSFGPLVAGGVLLKVVKCLPSYWLAQAGKTALVSSGGWPPAQAWIVIALWSAVLGRIAVRVYQRDTQRM